MRNVLVILGLLPCLFIGCDNGTPDGDADADVELCGEDSLQECNESPTCPEREVCLHHECVCMYERDYEIQIVSAAIYARAAGGHCWDGEAPTCEDPDPYALVEVNDLDGDYSDSYTTATESDTLAPIWNETFTVHMARRLQYGVTVFDADTDGSDDPILELPPLFWFDQDDLRSAGIHICTPDERTRTCVDLIVSPL